jgi:hypothetical protein
MSAPIVCAPVADASISCQSERTTMAFTAAAADSRCRRFATTRRHQLTVRVRWMYYEAYDTCARTGGRFDTSRLMRIVDVYR